MIKEFVEAWDKNKDKLEKYFTDTIQTEYDSYSKIVRKLFEIVINPYMDETTNWRLDDGFILDRMTVIDDSDYQGTQIFIIPLNTYQPSVEDYVYTNTYYGSCSGCDTLYGILSYDTDEKPNENQVREYMELALHLLQKCKWLENQEE